MHYFNSTNRFSSQWAVTHHWVYTQKRPQKSRRISVAFPSCSSGVGWVLLLLTDSHRVSKPVTTLVPKHQQQVGASHYAAIATFYPFIYLFALQRYEKILKTPNFWRVFFVEVSVISYLWPPSIVTDADKDCCCCRDLPDRMSAPKLAPFHADVLVLRFSPDLACRLLFW